MKRFFHWVQPRLGLGNNPLQFYTVLNMWCRKSSCNSSRQDCQVHVLNDFHDQLTIQKESGSVPSREQDAVTYNTNSYLIVWILVSRHCGCSVGIPYCEARHVALWALGQRVLDKGLHSISCSPASLLLTSQCSFI